MKRATILVAVLFVAAVAPAAVGGVAGAAGAGGAAAASNATQQSTGDLVRTTTLRLTPDDPGAVAAVVEYDTPSNLASLAVRARSGTVVSTDGFTETENGLQWDEDTENPSFTLSVEVNQTISGSRALPGDVHATPRPDAAQESGGYSFVDVGSWAILPVPQFSSQWTWYGSGSVTLSSDVTVAGEGAVGGTIAYLGPGATYSATGSGQEFRLVVPAAASLAESPDEILASLTNASAFLQVGARDEHVLTVAAPTSVNWGPAGLEYGGSDSWVLADSRLDTAGNVWLHEYVHTRQDFSTTSATQWVTEATAEYYAALLTLQQDRIGFDAFADHLRRGTRSPYASAVLANPYTWTYANYVKGPLVYGNVDRAIRLASDGEHTAEDVLGRLNVDTDGRVTQSEFLSAVAAAGSDDVASYAQRYTQTPAVPDMWSRAAHAAAFAGEVARLVASVPPEGVRVTGPYRNTTTGRAPTLVTGETANVSVAVTNEGGATGSFAAALTGPERTLDTAAVSVPPGETRRVTVAGTFSEPGAYTLTYGYETRTIRVRAPATPNATVEVNATTAAVGDAVRVSLTASNPAEYPATGTYPVVVDGETVETWTAALGPAETASFETSVTLEEPGAYTIEVGDRAFTVSVEETQAAGEPTGSTPGFGIAVALVSVLVALAVASRRR
ncbi:PGF-CTERM sorting domain-containing protein [Salarchaeum sp. JOR-1]|uniref:PGF-CTERM sorting domain-containing protein n=1 Tax=Salarchaeum sp. JOR-1 TaxID=2599399 RepID=UPI0011986B5F|nr:PGF-CTERM sorting domain-containing protein [Salarchaeum sp. JOR-1]QDX41082.1 PGF-CTERM sorting domain-containing protein [Salarchaeum sp. JOR-1]